MTEQKIVFEDGAAYERMMGIWSRIAGEVFLDWLAPPAGLRWLDVGCGNGAFTELIAERCAPAGIEGIDPSEGQLAFARTRHTAGIARFGQGDAMALPFADGSFDAAVMALVIFFVPDPAKGVAEMVRTVRRGGIVATYAWDFTGGGFPLEPFRAELKAMGRSPLAPPSAEASRMDALRGLWSNAGIEAVETREIAARRSFADFEDLWATSLLSSGMRPTIAAMAAAELDELKERVRARLPADAAGRITYGARANAIKGRLPQ